MLERIIANIKDLKLRTVKFVDGPKPEDFLGFELRRGHTKKYRGNHRSHVRGAGFWANWRAVGKKTIR